MAFPTVSILDDFNRANGAIGGNWLAGFGDSIPAVNGNAAKGSASGWYGAVWAPSGTPASFSADQEAFYTLTANDASAQTAGIIARGASLNTGSYTGYLVRIVTNVLIIGKFTAGVYSGNLATTGTLTVAAGDKIGIEIVGTSSPVSVRAYHAPAGVWGAATLTYSDSTSPITSGGQVGLSWNQTAANSSGADDFGAGTTAGAGSTDPAKPPTFTNQAVIRANGWW